MILNLGFLFYCKILSASWSDANVYLLCSTVSSVLIISIASIVYIEELLLSFYVHFRLLLNITILKVSMLVVVKWIILLYLKFIFKLLCAIWYLEDLMFELNLKLTSLLKIHGGKRFPSKFNVLFLSWFVFFFFLFQFNWKDLGES